MDKHNAAFNMLREAAEIMEYEFMSTDGPGKETYIRQKIADMNTKYSGHLKKPESDYLNALLIRYSNNSQIPISDIGISTRARKALEYNGIHNIGQLCSKSEKELKTFRNFGKKCLIEVKSALNEYHMQLGMSPIE